MRWPDLCKVGVIESEKEWHKPWIQIRMSSSSPSSDNRNFVTLTSSSGGLSKGQRVSPMQRPSKTEVFNRRSHSSESRTSSENKKRLTLQQNRLSGKQTSSIHCDDDHYLRGLKKTFISRASSLEEQQALFLSTFFRSWHSNCSDRVFRDLQDSERSDKTSKSQ